jgi:N-methylhydantoinase B
VSDVLTSAQHAQPEDRRLSQAADPVTTEVVRGGLNSAAEQMKITLCRTAYSPLIYEMVDFACALFDRRVRLLAQAEALPIFLGTMEFCVRNCVAAVGGEEELSDGDVLLSTSGYANGSHPNDVAVVVPVFRAGAVVGYAGVKAHLMDVGAKQPFCNDTTDIFQEGMILPGVHLYRKGELQRDVYRIALANTRVPELFAGDLNAEISCARVGAAALGRIIERVGREGFGASVEAMFDHGEAVVREFIGGIPDGVYSQRGRMDSNGVDDEPVDLGIAVEVQGADIVIDFTESAAEQRGPINCPLPATVSIARLAVMSLVGGEGLLNEGCLRPIAVRTRPGTLFHPEPPAPVFLYAWPPIQALEMIHQALAQAVPHAVTAPSGADIAVVIWWGDRPGGEIWTTGTDHFVGQGATHDGDGSAPLMHISCSGIRNTPSEVLEQRFPLIVRRYALAPDTGGPGRWRGGLGIDVTYEVVGDAFATLTLEHTLEPAAGVHGGRAAKRANSATVRRVDSLVDHPSKATAYPLPAGSVVEIHMGGGGGYGPLADRPVEQVLDDVREGYISQAAAYADYPHAFAATTEESSS